MSDVIVFLVIYFKAYFVIFLDLFFRPVTLEDFPQRLEKLHKDSNLLFSLFQTCNIGRYPTVSSQTAQG